MHLFFFSTKPLSVAELLLAFFIPPDDPHIRRLGGKCSFKLVMPGNRSDDAVALTAGEADSLAEWICRDLECGTVHHVNKTSLPANTTCFHRCDYADLRLKNCSQTETSDCTIISEAVCGEDFFLNGFTNVLLVLASLHTEWQPTLKELKENIFFSFVDS